MPALTPLPPFATDLRFAATLCCCMLSSRERIMKPLVLPATTSYPSPPLSLTCVLLPLLCCMS